MGDTPPTAGQGDPGYGDATATAPHSAWSRPATVPLTQSAPTQPSTGMLPPGFYPPPGPPKPPRTKLMWLIGGGAAAVLAIVIIVVVVLATSGSGGAVDGTVPHGADGLDPAPAGKVFTHVPTDSCTLVKQATIDSYAPGTTCKPSAFDAKDMPGLITRMPSWGTEMGQQQPMYVSMSVHLVVGSNAPSMYTMSKNSTVKVMGDFDTIQSQHEVTGLADEAYIVYGVSKGPNPTGDAVLIARVGNAEVDVNYHAKVNGNGTDDKGGPLRQQDAEAAATAAVKDIIGALS